MHNDRFSKWPHCPIAVDCSYCNGIFSSRNYSSQVIMPVVQGSPRDIYGVIVAVIPYGQLHDTIAYNFTIAINAIYTIPTERDHG